jgi:hypothetical protein
MRIKEFFDARNMIKSSVCNNLTFILGHIPLVLIYIVFSYFTHAVVGPPSLGFSVPDSLMIFEGIYFLIFFGWVVYLQRKIHDFKNRLLYNFLSLAIVYYFLVIMSAGASYPREFIPIILLACIVGLSILSSLIGNRANPIRQRR